MDVLVLTLHYLKISGRQIQLRSILSLVPSSVQAWLVNRIRVLFRIMKKNQRSKMFEVQYPFKDGMKASNQNLCNNRLNKNLMCGIFAGMYVMRGIFAVMCVDRFWRAGMEKIDAENARMRSTKATLEMFRIQTFSSSTSLESILTLT